MKAQFVFNSQLLMKYRRPEAKRGTVSSDPVPIVAALGCFFMVAGCSGCPPGAPSPPPTITLAESQPVIGRGGRAVAVSVHGTDSRRAIAAGESGGLFQTMDGGDTWSHVDSFPPFRMSDVAFVPAGFANPEILVATSLVDSNPDTAMNLGGVWVSTDGAASWTHVAPTAPCFGWRPASAYGIAFLAPDSVFVATDCGLLANTHLASSGFAAPGNWSLLWGSLVFSVAAQRSGNNVIIDVCAFSHLRSSDGGATWGPSHIGSGCQSSSHALAASPLESNVLLAAHDATVVESDDGGATWIDLHASADSTRPRFVTTRPSADGNQAHFDLYYSGRMTTCSSGTAGQRCPSNAAEGWLHIPNVPNTNFTHDTNAVAFDPATNCAMYQATDFGVFRKGPALPGQPCGALSTWTMAGKAEAGFGALQIYQVAGQVHLLAPAPKVGFTSLYIGTMDNMEHAVLDTRTASWSSWGVEGSFLQALSPVLPGNTPSDSELTFVDFGSGSFRAKKIVYAVAGGWNAGQTWTTISPPGSGAAPFLVGPSTYVQWSGNTLFLTKDAGATWFPTGVFPPNLTAMTTALQVTSTPAGPAVYAVLADSGGAAAGLALLTRFVQPVPILRVFEMRTLSGTNGRGFPSGLQGIWGSCFGQGAWYCQPIFSADPADYRHLYAVDGQQKQVMVSSDAGETWREDSALTNLVQASGAPMADSIGSSQIHTIAFDPANSAHVLVGTDQAGAFASANGGVTWSALPGTEKMKAITSFFFDSLNDAIFVATYGRGLWKLTVDWSTVH